MYVLWPSARGESAKEKDGQTREHTHFLDFVDDNDDDDNGHDHETGVRGDSSPTAILTIKLSNLPNDNFTQRKKIETRTTLMLVTRKPTDSYVHLFFDIKNSMLSRQFIFPSNVNTFLSCMRSSRVSDSMCIYVRARFHFILH